MVLYVANMNVKERTDEDCYGLIRLGLLDLLHYNFLHIIIIIVFYLMHAGKPIEERLRLYDSVIAKLTSTNELNESSAVAHAYRARAKYHLDVNEYELARQDALEAIRIRSGSAVDSLLKTELKVYRLLADAEEALGNFDGAVEAYREWKQLDPPSGTKLNGEIQRLLQHIHAEQSNSNSC